MDPYAVVANAVATIIQTEFAVEAFPVVHDHIHESVGHKGTRIGISPIDQVPQASDMNVLDTEVLIRFYGKYSKDIVDPDIKVDPRNITGYAHRLRGVLERTNIAASGDFWYLNIMSTDYPEDPLGNKTRFEMRIQAKGANSGLVETS